MRLFSSRRPAPKETFRPDAVRAPLRAPLTADLRPEAGTRVNIQGRAAEVMDRGRSRLLVTGVVFAVAFFAVGIRLTDVMVFSNTVEASPIAAAPAAPPVVQRADIVDRNGTLLATTLPTPSLYANPRQIIDPVEAADLLTAVMPDLVYAELLETLSRNRPFVWLHRGITPQEKFAINRLGIPGLGFQTEERRFYPFGNLTSHVVGFTGVDGEGLIGIEQSLDGRLRSSNEPVNLSIDIRVQTILREELLRTIGRHNAIAGTGIVMDVETGEVIAMVSLPDFNPADLSTMNDETGMNRASLGVYEMGSTFKVINTAAALEAGITTLHAEHDAVQPIRFGGFTIDDYRGQYRTLTTAEVLAYSSNIGSVRIAQDLGTERQQAFLDRLGLLQPASVELSEVGRPLIPDPWRPINTMTISFGHGLSVSPVSLVGAIGSMVNGGMLYEPTLLMHGEDHVLTGTRVIGEDTSESIRRLMRLVEERSASRDGYGDAYLIGGKTGTAEKPTAAGYNDDARVSSYVAAFPMTDPQYVVFALLDEPQGIPETHGFATGGWVAAPTVRRVVERIGPMLGVAPADPESPEIIDALWVDIPGRQRPEPLVHQAGIRN